MEELILYLAFGVIMSVVASAKGFNPVRWFFAAGLLGLIILFFLPSASAKDIDENEKLKRAKLGNKVGTVISVIALILAAILIIAGLIASDDPEEILPVLLFIFSIFGTTAIGVFIFLKVKKIKLDKSAIAGYGILSIIVSLILFFIQMFFVLDVLKLEGSISPGVFILFASSVLILITYLLGLLLWRKKIRDKKNEINSI